VVQEERPRRALDRAALGEARLAVPGADGVVVVGFEDVAGVLAEPLDQSGQGLAVLDDAIAVHQLGIGVVEDRAVGEPILVAEMEEERAAAQERLDVAAKRLGQQRLELGQELALATCPLQERRGVSRSIQPKWGLSESGW